MEILGASMLVTGAGSGLGLATARALAAEGARVIGLATPASIERLGHVDGVEFVAGDVSVEGDVARATALANERSDLRAAISCAGIAPAMRLIGRDGLHDQATLERALAVNVVGTFNVLRFAGAAMSENDSVHGGRGVIINTASVAAYEGQIGQVAYAATKAAVAGMTLPAARELARVAIRVMTIAPGVADTKMMAGFGEKVLSALESNVPFPPRLASPDEFARLAIAIIEHDYLNGETIRMDGALRMAAK